MTTFFLRFMSAAAVATVLAGCAAVPGDSFYEPAYPRVYGVPPVDSYPQPYIVRPYPAPPAPACYGRPGDDRLVVPLTGLAKVAQAQVKARDDVFPPV